MRATLITILFTSLTLAKEKNLKINPSIELATILGNFSILYGYVKNYDFYSRVDNDFFNQNQIALTGLRSLNKNERIFVYTFLIKQCDVDITKEKRIWEIVEKNNDFISLLARLKKKRFNLSNASKRIINFLDSNYQKKDSSSN